LGRVSGRGAARRAVDVPFGRLEPVFWYIDGPMMASASDGPMIRVAGTPHYDGARADAADPAVIAVSGIGPVRQAWVDPSRPVLRRW
jgi:hypothetical protein